MIPFGSSYLNANGGTDPNGAVGQKGAAILIPLIQDMTSTLKSMNLNKHIPVGNSDAGSYFSTQVLQVSEYGVRFPVRYIEGLFQDLLLLLDGKRSPLVWQRFNRSGRSVDLSVFRGAKCPTGGSAEQPPDNVYRRDWLAIGTEHLILGNLAGLQIPAQNSSDQGNMNNGASTASVANLQKFLDTYVCQATKNNTGYFYFEGFDEPWKVGS